MTVLGAIWMPRPYSLSSHNLYYVKLIKPGSEGHRALSGAGTRIPRDALLVVFDVGASRTQQPVQMGKAFAGCHGHQLRIIAIDRTGE